MKPFSMRSSWSRRTLSTSAHSIASSMRRNRQTPNSSMPRGISVSGPQTPTSAPIFRRPQIFDRATRECSTSPTRQTFMPSTLPCLSRIVSRSSSPCVGCSCLPSPALMTLERMRRARNSAAPDEGCRITTMSMRIASRFRAVSTSVSPFCTELPLAATFTVSADRRFSANSNEIRVRVDASKNRLTIVLPRSAGTFLIGRSETSLNGSAVSSTRRICSGVRCSRPTRSFPRTGFMPKAPRIPRLGWGYRWSSLAAYQVDLILSVQLFDEHVHPLPAIHFHLFANDIRLDRELAPAPIDQHAERDPLGAPEVGELVERGAHGPSGIEHVVDDHHVLAVQVAGDPRLADDGLGPDRFEVVAIEGDIEGAAGEDHALVFLDERRDPFGQLHTAPLDADEHEIGGAMRQLEHFDGHTLKRPRQGAGVQDDRAFRPAHLELGS